MYDLVSLLVATASCCCAHLCTRFLFALCAAGSIMLEKPAAVESVVKSLMDASPNLPVTLKVRTAHYGKKHQLHNVIGK